MSLVHVGKELRAALIERGDLSPEPLQVALDPYKLGLRSPTPMVEIVVRALHERLKLAPEEPQPWIPVNHTDSILGPASIAASISSCVSPNSLRAVLSLSVAPFRRQSSSTGCFLPLTADPPDADNSCGPGPLHCSSRSMRRVVVKGQPFSVRLQEETERLVEAEARRTRRTKSAVVEAFTEETARTRRFPGVAFRGDDARRRPWVIGSGLDVWEIVHMLEDFGSLEELVGDTQLSPAQVRLAMAYRDNYPDEIAEAILENGRPITDVAVLFPFITVADR